MESLLGYPTKAPSFKAVPLSLRTYKRSGGVVPTLVGSSYLPPLPAATPDH